MTNLKWLLSEQRQYMDGDPLAYENMSVPFAIILGDPHTTNRSRDARRLENNVIAQFLPEYILAEPGMGAWIFDPNKNETQLREDEPLNCKEDTDNMNYFLKLAINGDELKEKDKAFQSFQDQNDNNVNPDLNPLQFKLWSIRYKIPLVGCDLCLHEMRRFNWPSNEVRERKMGKIISDYAKNSKKPIIAIVGLEHTDRIHLILKEKNVISLILRY